MFSAPLRHERSQISDLGSRGLGWRPVGAMSCRLGEATALSRARRANTQHVGARWACSPGCMIYMVDALACPCSFSFVGDPARRGAFLVLLCGCVKVDFNLWLPVFGKRVFFDKDQLY